jgi:hypothetical protein
MKVAEWLFSSRYACPHLQDLMYGKKRKPVIYQQRI